MNQDVGILIYQEKVKGNNPHPKNYLEILRDGFFKPKDPFEQDQEWTTLLTVSPLTISERCLWL